jgi:hypothetical protein
MIQWSPWNTLLVANYVGGNVIQIPSTGGSGSVFCTFSPSVTGVNSVAINPVNGDVYISAYNSASTFAIYKVGAGGGTAAQFITTGLNYPQQLAFDKSLNLFVANFANDTSNAGYISMINIVTPSITTIIMGLQPATGLLIQIDGSILVTDYLNGKLIKFSHSAVGNYSSSLSSSLSNCALSSNGCSSLSCYIGSPPLYGQWSSLCSTGFIPSGYSCPITCSNGTVIGTAASCLNGVISGCQYCSVPTPFVSLPSSSLFGTPFQIVADSNK